MKDVKDLAAQLEAKPDTYTYASAGNGSAPAVTDTIGGQTQFMFPSLFTAMPHVKAGKLRALAVAGTKRSALLPDVPKLTAD